MPSISAREFIERRVPQVLAVYLGTSWAIVEFTNMVESRYLLSPHLTDLALLGLAVLLPSVVLFTWHHGRKGADAWHWSEKVFIPANLMGGVALVFLFFGGKDLGAVTTTKLVTDEAGNTIERVVPKSEYRKRVGLFYFDGANDEATGWLRYGITHALATDLYQEMFLDLRFAAHAREELREAGYPEAVGVPLSLQRRLADKMHVGYFVTGEVSGSADSPRVTVRLYDAERGGLESERVYEGGTILELADRISIDVRRELEIPDGHIDGNPDLPVSEILTASLPAFRDFVEAQSAIELRDDWAAAGRHLRDALAADPAFASAHFLDYLVALLGNDAQRAQQSIQSAMDHIYRVPERSQFPIKASYFAMRQEQDRAYGVVQMWTELFPSDTDAWAALAEHQKGRNEKDGAIASYRRILEIDPTQYEYLRKIGELHREKGEFEGALEQYRRYAERFPQDAEVHLSIGDLQRVQGHHAEARAAFEKALLLEPGDAEVAVRLAGLERDLGNYDAALNYLEDALAESRTAEDLGRVYEGLEDFHEHRGELTRSLEYLERKQSENAKVQPPFALIMSRLSALDEYARAGQAPEALARLEQLRAQLTPPWNAFVPVAELDLYVELRDAEKAEAAVAGVEQLIQTYSVEILRPRVIFARGRIAELRGDCATAIREWSRQVELDPTNVRVHLYTGRCWRERGDLDRAQQALERVLAVTPSHGEALYELALVRERRGDVAGAISHLEFALRTWAPADAVYEPARRAREKLAALKA